MKSNEYETVEHVDSDLTRMFENAKRYNVPHSSIYKRALKLQHVQQVSPCLHSSRGGAPVCVFTPLLCLDEEEGALAERGRRWRQHAVFGHV